MADPLTRLFRTASGPLAEVGGRCFLLANSDWDDLVNDRDLRKTLMNVVATGTEVEPPGAHELLAPIGRQEVWAAGVTYVRSKAARMTEARETGGGDFYDRVYVADRPELFFKATAHRVAGPGQPVRIRSDARWNVPEPELALAVNAAGSVFGYTIGNDMSARDIEGENPLYLPQAKVYDQCCGLGPCILIQPEAPPPESSIRLTIFRSGETIFDDAVTLSEMKRTAEELVAYLLRDQSFPYGFFLLTGTGIVPPDSFTLQRGDRIRITIEPIGSLENHVVQHHA